MLRVTYSSVNNYLLFFSAYGCVFYRVSQYLSIRDILLYRIFGGIRLFPSNCKKKYILNQIPWCTNISPGEYRWSHALHIFWGTCMRKIRTIIYLWFPRLSSSSDWNLSSTKVMNVFCLMNVMSYLSFPRTCMEEKA